MEEEEGNENGNQARAIGIGQTKKGASAVSELQDGRQRNSHPNQPYFSDISPRKYGLRG